MFSKVMSQFSQFIFFDPPTGSNKVWWQLLCIDILINSSALKNVIQIFFFSNKSLRRILEVVHLLMHINWWRCQYTIAAIATVFPVATTLMKQILLHTSIMNHLSIEQPSREKCENLRSIPSPVIFWPITIENICKEQWMVTNRS